MLVLVYPFPLLRRALAEQFALCNVIIHTLNIGISMVEYIVFLFPEKSIAA